MIKNIKDGIYDLVIYDFKYLMSLFLVVIICMYPLNYYIVIGGGISDIKSRVTVDNGYESSGSFNISFVKESEGTLLTYGLSKLIPSWEAEPVGDYTYNDVESVKDVTFRNNLSLKEANSNATYVAYTKANKKIELVSSKYYVITKEYSFDECNLNVGDEILELDGNSIDGFDYRSYINSLNEGDYVNVKVIRDDKEEVIKTKVYRNSDRLILGIYINVLNSYKTDPKVKIEFKNNESGSSGGLMTTLSIYNQLVKEDITKGLTIAGTGTIDEDGNVGEIGGVEHKVLGAVAGGADIFLVPKENNYEQVMKAVKKNKLKIKVIPVSTFDETLEVLSKLST